MSMTSKPADMARRTARAGSWGGLLVVAAACSSTMPNGASQRGAPLELTHGPAFIDVTHASARVWARANGPGTIRVNLKGHDKTVWLTTQTSEASDFTGHVTFAGLSPNTPYQVGVELVAGKSPVPMVLKAREGSFRTAPAPDVVAPVSFAFGGDLGGQNVCRDRVEGYPIFKALAGKPVAFFVALGDMIYADDVCAPVGRYGNAQVPGAFGKSRNIQDFRMHWQYNRADGQHASFLASTPYVPIWDDHEVTNDFGPHQLNGPRGGKRFVGMGLKAFLEYNPVPAAALGMRLFRALRWGKHVEVFVLDTRQYRSANRLRDSERKTMLGQRQRSWLLDRVPKSSATWKFVVSSVPIAVPTGAQPERNGRDGWADLHSDTGFEAELRTILDGFRKNGVKNLVFLSTDVHFAAALRYAPFQTTPEFTFHEFISGPLSGGVGSSRELDATFHPERIFQHAPRDQTVLGTYQDARQWMNIGLIRIDEQGMLEMSILDEQGDARETLSLDPEH